MIEEDIRVALLDADIPGLLEYGNLPKTIGAVVSARIATLHECDTVYSIEDVYLLLEVIIIDAHNRVVADKWHNANAANR